MTGGRLHLLAQAALCFEQAGLPLEAARCRERAGELVAAAALYRAGGDLTRAASCHDRAGQTAEAVSCLLAMGRARDAAELWVRARRPLDAAWVLALDARRPAHARSVLAGAAAGDRQPVAAGLTAVGGAPVRRAAVSLGDELRLQLVQGVCSALERHPDRLVTALHDVEQQLAAVTPASDQERLSRWAVQAADHLRRPDLAAGVLAAAYRCRLRGTATRWREWARPALGGTAGVPERDL